MYKKAWKCKKCPETNNENGCPAWTELMVTNIQSGEEKLEKDCLYRMLPMLLVEVIKASNRPAAEIGSLKNGMINAISELAESTQQLMVEKDKQNLIEE